MIINGLTGRSSFFTNQVTTRLILYPDALRHKAINPKTVPFPGLFAFTHSKQRRAHYFDYTRGRHNLGIYELACRQTARQRCREALPPTALAGGGGVVRHRWGEENKANT